MVTRDDDVDAGGGGCGFGLFKEEEDEEFVLCCLHKRSSGTKVFSLKFLS